MIPHSDLFPHPHNPFPTLTTEPPASDRDLKGEVARATARENQIERAVSGLAETAKTFATKEGVSKEAAEREASETNMARELVRIDGRLRNLEESGIANETVAALRAADAEQNASLASLRTGIESVSARLATLVAEIAANRIASAGSSQDDSSPASGGIGETIRSLVGEMVADALDAYVTELQAGIDARIDAVSDAADAAQETASAASTMTQTPSGGNARYVLRIDDRGVARVYPIVPTANGWRIATTEDATLSPLVAWSQVVVNGHSLPANGTGITLTGADIRTGQFGRTIDSVLNRDGNTAVLYYRGAWQSNSNLAYGPSDANAQIGDLVVLSRQETVNSVSLPAGTAIFYDGDLWKPLGGGGGGSAADASQVPMSSNWWGPPNVEAVLNEIKGDISGLMNYVGYNPYSH